MQNNNSGLIANKQVVKNFYYLDTSRLNIRLETWKKYGTNSFFIHDWILNSIAIRNNKIIKLLDLGCGNGDLINLIGQKYKKIKIYGLDISKKMVELSIKRNPKCNITVGDAEKLSFESNFFDYLIAIHLLHHVTNIKKAIKGMMRVIKNNGSIFIVTGNYELDTGLNRLHYEALEELRFPNFMLNKRSYLRFTNNEAINYFKELNIKFKSYQYINNLSFRSVKPVMAYYGSAMMYRNSIGPNDKRIKNDQWKNLFELVRKKVIKEMEQNKQFIIPGKVCGYKIRKKL